MIFFVKDENYCIYCFTVRVLEHIKLLGVRDITKVRKHLPSLHVEQLKQVIMISKI